MSTAVPPPRTLTHRLARWCVRPLVGTGVRPNHLTTLRLTLGASAALAFALGQAPYLFAGALFAFSTLLDRADGELARIADMKSAAGHRYDIASDLLVNMLVFIGIGFGLTGSPLGLWALVLGIVAGVCIAGIFLTVFGLHDAGTDPQKAFGAAPGFDLDDGLFLLVPLAWMDLLVPVLVITALGAPLFLVYASYQYRKARWAARASG